MPELTPEILLSAYQQGIFPMGDQDNNISWYAPDPRCIIELESFHATKRLLRLYRQNKFELCINKSFSKVMEFCSKRGKDFPSEDTWISPAIIEVYTQLHNLGFAHSVEAYYDKELVGGLYGVSLGGAFMGESMFHTMTNASKISLVFLIEHLKSRNFKLLDCQYMTSHLASFGATYISRQSYLSRLEKALAVPARFI